LKIACIGFWISLSRKIVLEYARTMPLIHIHGTWRPPHHTPSVEGRYKDMLARRARQELVLAWVAMLTALTVACSGQGDAPNPTSASTGAPVVAAVSDNTPEAEGPTDSAETSEEPGREEYAIPPKDCEAVAAEDVRSIVGPYRQILSDASEMQGIPGVETDCTYVADDASSERSIYVAIYRPDKSRTTPDRWDDYWTQRCADPAGQPPDLTRACYSDGTLTISKHFDYLEVTIKTPEIQGDADKTSALERALAEKVLSRLAHPR
jgi:hypothetical protein